MAKMYIGEQEVAPVVPQIIDKKKFGVSIDNILGNVDVNGVYVAPTDTFVLDFGEVKELGLSAFNHQFYGNENIIGVVASSLQMVRTSGLNNAFAFCGKITSVNLRSLQHVSASGMPNTFNGCTGLTSIDLGSLQTVMDSGMNGTFNGCSALTSIDLSSLQTLEGLAFYSAFVNTKLTTISFPSLTSVKSNSFGTSTYAYAFRGCTVLVEIHFRADMQAQIEAMTGYAEKWGATNATIYFDL